jgi:hypothetical protein
LRLPRFSVQSNMIAWVMCASRNTTRSASTSMATAPGVYVPAKHSGGTSGAVNRLPHVKYTRSCSQTATSQWLSWATIVSAMGGSSSSKVPRRIVLLEGFTGCSSGRGGITAGHGLAATRIDLDIASSELRKSGLETAASFVGRDCCNYLYTLIRVNVRLRTIFYMPVSGNTDARRKAAWADANPKVRGRRECPARPRAPCVLHRTDELGRCEHGVCCRPTHQSSVQSQRDTGRMKSTTNASEPEIYSAAVRMKDDLIATDKLVNVFDSQREIDRIDAIFTKARALVAEVLLSRFHRTLDGS